MATTASQNLLAQADAVIEWYWRYGVQRTEPKYEIPRGTWLDEIYRVRDRARATVRAEAGAKPVMALWGPSQTGKSTLLSGYLDRDDDPLGKDSPLCWSEAEPVRFVAGSVKSDEIICLNPYNFDSDASGCVSRFVLRDRVSDPEHPVEIEFATESQLMQALATGYLSECDPRNDKGEVVSWNEDSFKALLERQRSAGAPQRAAFEVLQQIADTIDLLILAGLPRYANLEQPWKKYLRSQILQSSALLGSIAAIETFAGELFWDKWTSITQTYERLVTRRRQIRQEWGDAPVRCSFRTAAVLLDIDSYKKYSGDGTGAAGTSAIRQKVDKITVSRTTDGFICLGQKPGTPLVDGAEEFGVFQALVWELRIPLRQDVLQQRAPVLAAFFEKANLLDFPGVANSSGNAKPHTDSVVQASPQIALTQVLKRGKTASIVVTSARNLDIDGFSILVRMDRFPPSCKQLVTGIKSWMQSYNPAFWPPNTHVLPLNLVTTFSAWLVNKVRGAGTRDGLQPVFDRLKDLAELALPKVVSTFATNYPQFDDGKINGDQEEQQQAVNAIINDAAFCERFGDGAKSFQEMFANGGTDHFFHALAAQAAGSHRAQIVAERMVQVADHLHDLLLQQVPGENAEATERERALADWTAAIEAQSQAPAASREEVDGVTSLSLHLRSFVNVDPEELEDVPQNALQRRLNVRAFIEKQFRIWQDKRANFPHLAHLGLTDGTHARRVLSYLVEATDLKPVEEFFEGSLGHLSSRNEGKHARRFLAVEMNNALLDRRGALPSTHRPVVDGAEAVPVVLGKFAANENHQTTALDQSPHFVAVIAPFLRRIQTVKTLGASIRPPQAGDAELLALVHRA